MPDAAVESTTIRAVVIDAPGSVTRLEDLAMRAPGPGEVRVRIAASGVCHSDLHVRDGDWQRPGPMVMGHEGSGWVEAVGPGVDRPSVGDFVALTWYYPCLRCRHCRAGREWLCEGSGSLQHRLPDGSTALRRADGTDVPAYLGIGTFAEATVTAASAAVPLPPGVPPEVAALIGCCVSTGVGSILKTAAVPAGATVCVIGLGGVGLSAVMGAVLAGASRIVAVDRVPAKLETARELGATDVIQAGDDPVATTEAIRAATDGGPDFCVEAIGLRLTVEQAIAVLPPGGTAVLAGLTPFGVRSAFEVFPFVDGSRRILGSNYGSTVAALDFPAYADLFLAGRLPIDRLVSHLIGLEDVEAAFDAMRRGEGVRQVVVFDRQE
jgi:S-(hydroxymethyl)glutathione dehydrogenase/alcohol dehydrogenase